MSHGLHVVVSVLSVSRIEKDALEIIRLFREFSGQAFS